MRSAQGPDELDCRAVLSCDSEDLRELFQACIDGCIAPQAWLTAIVAAVKKPKAAGTATEHYRTIGLESCALKTLTLLIERRLREWTESSARIPANQSGFRKDHRTLNPAFVLRALVEKARAVHKPLIVVFLDLKNAFPSVDQPTLWAKLPRWGASGPLLDWLRMLYSHLSYLVRFQGELSEEQFQAATGILIGDPASPILWILYISDFVLETNSDEDLDLAGIVVNHQWLADDAMLVSTATPAMQAILMQFDTYCADNSLTISVPKTHAAIFWVDTVAAARAVPTGPTALLRTHGNVHRHHCHDNCARHLPGALRSEGACGSEGRQRCACPGAVHRASPSSHSYPAV